MKLLLTLLTAIALTGCVTFPQGTLANRLACSVAKDELYVVSKYGPIGISSQLDDKDRAVVCK